MATPIAPVLAPVTCPSLRPIAARNAPCAVVTVAVGVCGKRDGSSSRVLVAARQARRCLRCRGFLRAFIAPLTACFQSVIRGGISVWCIHLLVLDVEGAGGIKRLVVALKSRVVNAVVQRLLLVSVHGSAAVHQRSGGGVMQVAAFVLALVGAQNARVLFQGSVRVDVVVFAPHL